MKRDLVAIVPGAPDFDAPEGLVFMHHAGWSAVVSTAPSKSLLGRALRENRLNKAADRQRQLEALMPLGPVLPVLPGTCIKTKDVAHLIVANGPLLDRMRRDLAGQVQWQIMVRWDAANVLKHFRREPEIAPLFSEDAIRPERLVHAISRLAERLRGRIVSKLEPISQEIVELPVEDGLIANIVILSDITRTDRLDAALQEVDAIWPDGFRIKQIGPGPATSFASLSFNRIGRDGIARARRCLQVGEASSPDQVRNARQMRLREPQAPVEEIRHAFEVLVAHARLPDGANHVHLLDIWSESSVSGSAMAEAV